MHASKDGLTPQLLRIVEGMAQDILAQLKSLIDQLLRSSKQISDVDNSCVSKGFLSSASEMENLINELRTKYDAELETCNLQLELLPDVSDFGSCNTGRQTSAANFSRSILSRILVPILHSLARCYKVLDRAPAPSQQVSRSNKPVAPVGMLSVQQYTDIAVALEILVQLGIEPYLESGTSDRHIPRTLKGRLTPHLQSWITTHLAKATEDSYLEKCTLLLGELLILDRFRPMVNRHVPDMYGALLQLDHSAPLAPTTQELVLLFGLVENPDSIVDPIMQARSFQWLLRKGMQSPSWLRKAVGVHLADLSCRNLPAVTQIFVGAFPVGMQPTATARLAQTLTTTPDGMKDADQVEYHDQLVAQLWTNLDLVGLKGTPGNVDLAPIADLHRMSSARDQALIETVRQILDQLPPSAFGRVLPGLVQTCRNNKEGVHRVIRRLGMLLLNCRNPSDRLRNLFLSRIQLFTEDPPETAINMLGLIVRLASLHSLLKARCKDDAIWVLRSWVHTFCGTADESGVMLIASSLVHSLAPYSGDLQRALKLVTAMDTITPYDLIVWDDTNGANGTVEQVARDIERRADVLVAQVVTTLCSTDDDDGDQGNQSEIGHGLLALPSKILQLVLTIYFSSGMQAEHSLRLRVPQEHLCSILFRCEIFHIVALVTLPVLCESCSPASLLYTTEKEASGIFELMRLCFSMASYRFGVWCQEEMESSMHESLRAYDTTGSCFVSAAKMLRNLLKISDASATEFDNDMSTSDDMVISITSILMTILVGILELGARSRSDTDENMMRSFVRSLRPLAALEVGCDNSDLSETRSQLAEMAGHSMALIAARSIRDDNSEGASVDCPSTSSGLVQAERDLNSTEPPIRARGVVSLRYAAARLEGNSSLSGSSGTMVQPGEDTDAEIVKITELCFLALADSESYVYLAAIQTLVGITDAHPGIMVESLVNCLSHGELRVGGDAAKNATGEQRIKVGEILIFFFRRRATIYQFLPIVFDILTFGDSRREHFVSQMQHETAARETHDYFSSSKDYAECEDEDQIWEEQHTRLKTGGPLFQIEEEDVVRASKINVVAEAIMLSPPAVCEPYLQSLLHCAVDTIQLETSRIVRRAGALLSRELYHVLLRESQITQTEQYSASCAAALVGAQEERLFAALQRCISGDDIKDLRDQEGRLFDPATRARCMEALSNRDEAKSEGLLAAGRLVADRRAEDDANPLVKLLDVSSTTVNTTGTMSTVIQQESNVETML